MRTIGRHTRMFETVPALSATCFAVSGPTVTSGLVAWMELNPKARLVAAMLSPMYVDSSCCSFGFTRNCCTNAG